MIYDKPRFIFQLEHIYGKRILSINKNIWNGVFIEQEKIDHPVEIRLEQTPLSNITKMANVVVSFAVAYSNCQTQVKIVRFDQKDEKPFNTDVYELLKNIPTWPDYHNIITSASTEDNENLRNILNNNIYLIKVDERSIKEHWSLDLPYEARLVLEVKNRRKIKDET